LGVGVERAQVLFGFDDVNRVNLIFDQRRLAGVAPARGFQRREAPAMSTPNCPKCDGRHILTAAYVT
jgi:hypothetical protein